MTKTARKTSARRLTEILTMPGLRTFDRENITKFNVISEYHLIFFHHHRTENFVFYERFDLKSRRIYYYELATSTTVGQSEMLLYTFDVITKAHNIGNLRRARKFDNHIFSYVIIFEMYSINFYSFSTGSKRFTNAVCWEVLFETASGIPNNCTIKRAKRTLTYTDIDTVDVAVFTKLITKDFGSFTTVAHASVKL